MIIEAKEPELKLSQTNTDVYIGPDDRLSTVVTATDGTAIGLGEAPLRSDRPLSSSLWLKLGAEFDPSRNVRC